MYQDFISTVYDHYHTHGRHDLPWRNMEPDGSFDPYKILVSELMLQQTQVVRVIPKYQAFLRLFPTIQTLAAAELGDVLAAWSGLGYNRRAKFLWQAARMVVDDYQGVFPSDTASLTKLPGVGVNTAGAICAYAYNQPVVFLETNIRTIFIHHFFNDQASVDDKLLLPIVAATIDQASPRDWYWALMDYGTQLKQSVGNASAKSRGYKKQSTFAGSHRQLRGQIVKTLVSGPRDLASLALIIQDDRLPQALIDLERDGLVRAKDGIYSL